MSLSLRRTALVVFTLHDEDEIMIEVHRNNVTVVVRRDVVWVKKFLKIQPVNQSFEVGHGRMSRISMTVSPPSVLQRNCPSMTFVYLR